MKFCHGRGFIDRESYVAQYLTLSIFIVGLVSALGSDDLLAVFAAGKVSLATLASQFSNIFRICYFMGRRLQHPDRRGSIRLHHRPSSQLWMLHLHRRMASL